MGTGIDIAQDLNCGGTDVLLDATCDEGISIPELPDGLPEIEMPTIGTVTEEAVDGNGVFDIYMRAGMNQLETQYKEGRIKGADYAATFLGMTELMMTQANKFVIDEYTARVQGIQAELAIAMFEYQYLSAQYDAALKRAQATKAINESALICQQKEELRYNGRSKRKLETAQEKVACAQISLYDEQSASFNKKSANETFKTISNMWTIFISEVNDNPENVPDVLAGSEMQKLIDSARTKVGV